MPPALGSSHTFIFMEIRNKIFNELNEDIFRLKYEIAYVDHMRPETEKMIEEAQKEADEIKAKLEELTKSGDQKKKAVREEMKQVSHAFGKAMQKVGNIKAVMVGAEENKKQYQEKLEGKMRRLEFIQKFELQ